MKKTLFIFIIFVAIFFYVAGNSNSETGTVKESNDFLDSYSWKNTSCKRVGSAIYWMVPDVVRSAAMEQLKTKLNTKLSETTDNLVTWPIIRDVIKDIVPVTYQQLTYPHRQDKKTG